MNSQLLLESKFLHEFKNIYLQLVTFTYYVVSFIIVKIIIGQEMFFS